MDQITPLGRAILEVLDTKEHGTGDTEILGELLFGDTSIKVTDKFDRESVVQMLVYLLDAELISARFREQPRDMACTADPIIYSITEAGCEALWALMRADTTRVVQRWAEEPHKEHLLPHPVHFESRAAMREYLRGAA